MKTTSDPRNWKFHFTVTDLGRFLGKSPVTLRSWEQKKFIYIPRDPSGDRRLNAREVTGIAQVAYDKKRINRKRRDLVCASMTMIELIEEENNHQ